MKKALILELLGLFILLGATCWQISWSDWYEKQENEWNNLIQKETDLVILKNISSLSRQLEEQNSETRKHIHETIMKETKDRYDFNIKEYNTLRKWTNNGQYVWVHIIRYCLFVIGSILIIISKYLSIHNLKNKDECTDGL